MFNFYAEQILKIRYTEIYRTVHRWISDLRVDSCLLWGEIPGSGTVWTILTYDTYHVSRSPVNVATGDRTKHNSSLCIYRLGLDVAYFWVDFWPDANSWLTGGEGYRTRQASRLRERLLTVAADKMAHFIWNITAFFVAQTTRVNHGQSRWLLRRS